MLDEIGIVLQLQNNLTVNFARYLAKQKFSLLKRYHIGNTYKKNTKLISTSPLQALEASFDIASMPSGAHYTSGDEIIYEAEVIKVSDQIASYYTRDIGKYRIKVNSTEVLDGILEEAKVKVNKRHRVIKILS